MFDCLSGFGLQVGGLFTLAATHAISSFIESEEYEAFSSAHPRRLRRRPNCISQLHMEQYTSIHALSTRVAACRWENWVTRLQHIPSTRSSDLELMTPFLSRTCSACATVSPCFLRPCQIPRPCSSSLLGCSSGFGVQMGGLFPPAATDATHPIIGPQAHDAFPLPHPRWLRHPLAVLFRTDISAVPTFKCSSIAQSRHCQRELPPWPAGGRTAYPACNACHLLYQRTLNS
jgi:hypothetical protein